MPGRLVRTKRQESMSLPAELPGSSSSIFYRGKDGLKTFFFFKGKDD